MVKILLDHNAQVDLPNNFNEQRPSLMIASSCGYSQIVSLLLEHGAIVDLQDCDGECALMAATRSGYQDIVYRHSS